MRAMFLAAIVVALAVSASGCGYETLDDASCPTAGTPLTYDNFGKQFFLAYCNYCHSADLGMRKGAPDNQVFDTLAQVRTHKERIFARAAGHNDSMPPGPDDPPLEAREHLAEWLACGAP